MIAAWLELYSSLTMLVLLVMLLVKLSLPPKLHLIALLPFLFPFVFCDVSVPAEAELVGDVEPFGDLLFKRNAEINIVAEAIEKIAPDTVQVVAKSELFRPSSE